MLHQHAMAGGKVYPPADIERQILLQGNFASNYETAIPWDFVNNAFNPSLMSTTHMTVGGGPGIEILFKQGATPGDRWGGRIDLPQNVFEAWFTYTMHLVAPYSPGTTNFSGKLPGLAGVLYPVGCIDVPTCADSWSARHMYYSKTATAADPFVRSGEQMGLRQYHYYPFKTQRCGDNEDAGEIMPMNTDFTIEQYVRVNSAFNVQDGIDVTKLNGQIVKSTNIVFYCNSEANRANAAIAKIAWQTLNGGSTPAWNFAGDSRIRYGPWKVEIAA